MSIQVTSDGEVLVYFRFNYTLFESPTPAGDKLEPRYNEFTDTTQYFWSLTSDLMTFGDFESYFQVWGFIEDPNEIGSEEPFATPFFFETDPAENGFDYYRKYISYYTLTPPSEEDWWAVEAPEFGYYDSLKSDTYTPFIEGKYGSQFIPVSVLHQIPSQYKFISLAENIALDEALAEQRADLADAFGEEDITGNDIIGDTSVKDLTRAILKPAAKIGVDFLARTADAIKVVGDFTADAARKVHDTLAPVLRDTMVERASDAIGESASDAVQALMKEMAEAIGSDAAVRANLINALDSRKQIYVQKEGALRKVILLDNGETREANAWTAKEAADIKARFLDSGLSEEQKIIRDVLKSLENDVRDEVKSVGVATRGALPDKFGGLTGGALNDIADGFAQVVRPGLAFGNVTLGTLDYGFTPVSTALALTGDAGYALGDNTDNHVTSDAARTRVALDDGNDRFEGGTGQDEVSGDAGADVLLGGGGGDWLYGGGGNDTVKGGSGFDALLGAGGRDKVLGGAGGDLLIGGGGNDTLKGGSGNDDLRGDAGRDKLIGQGGDDLLLGGTGKDVLKGGGGSDVFRFETEKEAGRGKNADKIIGFASGEDKIDLSELFLTFLGTADFTGARRELRWDADAGRLFGDIDGDGATDLALIVKGDFTGDINDLIL